ncbi:nucleic acid/nucleotide deaminase domain-containing protein [Nocardia sp. IFM 10818]
MSRTAALGALLTGVLVAAGCSTVPGHPVAAQNKAPFYSAVLDLMTQSVVRYTGTDAAGGNWDIRATSGGETLGKITEAGQQTEVLTLGDKTYVKPPQNLLLSNLPAGMDAASVAGRWVTGNPDLAAAVPAGNLKPHDLAAALMAALRQTVDFPRDGDPNTRVRIGDEDALQVETPAGVLAVTEKAPYRVLRLDPTPESGTWTGDSEIGAQIPDSGAIVFGLLSPTDRDRAYDDLVAATQSLHNAVNVGVEFNFDRSGNIDCSDTACTVTVNVTSSATATNGATVTGSVAATMQATVTVDGQPAAGCSAAQTIPINGSGVLSCVDTSVAPIVAGIKARKQAEANAQAQAQGRDVTITYSIPYNASVQVQALATAQAEIDKAVGGIRNQQNAVRNLPPYKQVPYNSDELSRAALRARNAAGADNGKNVAVARVPNWNDPKTGPLVIGMSTGPGNYAEQDIAKQLIERGFTPEQITEFYSERQPCITCGPMLEQQLGSTVPVTYSIPWSDDNQTALAAGDVLKLLIEQAGGTTK